MGINDRIDRGARRPRAPRPEGRAGGPEVLVPVTMQEWHFVVDPNIGPVAAMPSHQMAMDFALLVYGPLVLMGIVTIERGLVTLLAGPDSPTTPGE